MITAVPERPTSTMRSSLHSMATGASTIRGGATLSQGTFVRPTSAISSVP